MKHHQLKAFVQVAESGTIRAAARSLHLSQSALTKALRELEEEVSAELLVRSYRGVEFTLAGRALLARARLALASLEKAREEIRLIRGGSGARVAVSTTPLVAVDVLPRVLKAFARLQPDVELALSEGFLSMLIPGLLEGQIDFAVAIADPVDLPHELVFEPLTTVSASAAARKGHPLAGSRGWAALQDATWVMNLSAGSQSESLMSWLQDSGLPVPRRVVRCSSPTLMVELMRRTDMIGYCPDVLLKDAVYSAGIERLRVRPIPPPMSLGLITLRGVPLTSAAKPLAALFKTYLSR